MVPAEYRVGDLENYKEGDEPVFTGYNGYDKAIDHAVLLSYTDSPIGVWEGQYDNMKLVAIVYQQKAYIPL